MQYSRKYKDSKLAFTLSKVLILLCFMYSGSVIAQPVISIKEGKQFDLGEVREGKVIEKKLTVVNPGNQTLDLGEIRTSCGCTVVKTPKKKLAPKESEVITISIDSKGFKGKLKKEVYIDSNDPRTPELTVTMFMTVRNSIEFLPTFLNFRVIPMGTERAETLIILNTTKKTIKILSAVSPEPQLVLPDLKRAIPPESSISVPIRVKSTKKGQILGQLTLTTDDPEKPEIKVSFIGKIQ